MAHAWIDKSLALIDRLSPEPRTDSREDRRRVRALVAATLIGWAILTVTAVNALALGIDRENAMLNLVWATALLAVLAVARRRRAPALLANTLVALGFSHTLLLSVLSGGRNVGALFAFAVFPLLAVLLAGWRSGVVFTGLAVAAVILTPMLPHGLLAQGLEAPDGFTLIRDALNVIVAIGLVAVLYDAVRGATLRDARESRALAEHAADRQQRLLELSGRLHEAAGQDFESVLASALKQTAHLAGADRTLLQLLPGAGGEGRFVWREDGEVAAEPATVADWAAEARRLSWASKRILEGRVTQVHRLDELPPEAEGERATLEQRGVASWLCIPIRAAGRTIGFQLFETTRREKAWDAEEVAELQLMTELLASTVLRHRTEEALRESEQKFSLAFRGHPDAMIIIDLETDEILECNEQWLLEIDQTERADVLGSRPWDFGFELPDEHREAMRRLLLADGRVLGAEVPVTGRGGEERTYLVSATRIELGGRACAVINVHDLTDRKQLEQQLLHAQKMEAVGRLAGGVAHDYNNMLTVIAGYSADLISRLDGDLRQDAEEIHAAARRSAELTRQLLAFSRRQVLQTEVLDPNGLLSGLESMLRPLIGESIHLRLDLADDPGCVRSDRGQLEQAIVNLVVNARDAMPEGGTLTLQTRRAMLSASDQPDLEPGAYVEISVADQGEGMDPDLVEHVMEPFYTTKPEGRGTGLGLPMVHGLARQCGGTLRLESETGSGTRVIIYLPAVIDELELATPSAPARAGDRARGSGCILLVEDEDRVRRLAARALRGAGYEVEAVEDGERALERAAALGDQLDLLLSDVVMPRLSGTALAHSLREARPDLPVVLMSGYPDAAKARPIPEDVVFLLKPFGPRALCDAVAQALVRKSADTEPLA